MMDYAYSKEVFSAIALILTFAAFAPYVRAILKGDTRPHAFSLFIWAGVTITVFAAQLAGGAGIGAWPIGVSGLITASVAILAWAKSADLHITRSDWVFLVLAGSALPLWVWTSDALSAVIILTSVDLLGFGPSVRKAYFLPHEENATFFGIGALRNGFVILALEHYSWTTALFPAAVGGGCAAFVILILARRSLVQPVR